MKQIIQDLFSFVSLLAIFLGGSELLYRLAIAWKIDGFVAFLVFCIPFLMVLTWTTMEDDEGYLNALVKNALWGYSLILSVAGVAWFIGML